MTKKVTKKEKDDATYKFLTKYINKFDKLMKDASKEKESLPVDCSVHALSSMVVQSIATNMANYYGGMTKVKETFQTALDEEANFRYIQAKEERENISLKESRNHKMN